MSDSGLSRDKLKSLIQLISINWLESLLLLYFGLRLIFFAVKIVPFLPPDEVTHFNLCRIFSKTLLLPDNSPGTYRFGLVTNIPYLYYWIMGKLLHLNLFGIPDLVYLRLLNIPLAFLNLLYMIRLLKIFSSDRLVRILLLAITTNILMFTILSASVSYDNLTNLFSTMSIFYTVSVCADRSVDNIPAAIFCQMAAALTKITFLPLMLMVDIVLLVYIMFNRRVVSKSVCEYAEKLNYRKWMVVVGILILFGLNLKLYLWNQLHYKTLAPEMQQVLTEDAALKYRIAARGLILSLFREDKISKVQALEMASAIEHSGDREDTVFHINNMDALKKGVLQLEPFKKYVLFWISTMIAGILGIFAHIQMPAYGVAVVIFMGLIISALTGLILRWRSVGNRWLIFTLLTLSVGYSSFLLYFVNYQAYLNTGSPLLGLQGRYIFPVMAPMAILASIFLPALFKNNNMRVTAVVAVVLFFFASDLPFFLQNVTSEWFVR